MQIINCNQNSEEWYKIRLGIATASSFSKIITSTGKSSTSLKEYAYQLVSEKLALEQDEFYSNAILERGNELENEAREYYEEICLKKVDQVGFILNKDENYGYSPDGLIGNDGLIEIKCPLQKNHTKYLYDNILPTEYKAQVQGGLLVSNRKWCDFISYHPNFIEEKKMLIIRIVRDEEYIQLLRTGLKNLIELKNSILEQINK